MDSKKQCDSCKVFISTEKFSTNKNTCKECIEKMEFFRKKYNIFCW